MKQKKPSGPAPKAAPAPAPAPALTALDRWLAAGFTLLLFIAMTVQTTNMSLVLAVIAVIAALAGFSRWGKRLCVPVLGLGAFALMNGLAAVYSPFASSAQEFYKVIAWVSVAVILLALFERRHVRLLLWGFAAVCAVISLLCVDSACAGGLYRAFLAVAEGVLGADYSGVEVFAWSRVAGIYNDANISAAILGLGTIAGLYLVRSENRGWRRALACVLMGVSAQGFFLSMSRGAILCFGLALLVWLAAVRGGERLPLFFLMLISAVTTMALSVPAMRGISTESILPDALTVLTGGVIALLDWGLTDRIARLLAGRGKAVGIVIGVLAVVSGVYIAVALNITGPYTFQGNILILDRMQNLRAGEYVLSGDWDEGEGMIVNISGRTAEQILLSDPVQLYSGPLDGALFTLDEDMRVDFRFFGEEGKQLRRLVLSDGTEIAPQYPLIPEYVADRFQGGLLSSGSFVQRVQYDKDTFAIFLTSPLWGRGLGATEHLYASVQPYYYTSLYAHNHLLQVMAETGLLGLAAFLALLLGVGWLLLRRCREDSMAAVLLACWVLLNTHSLMEINFSVRAFQCAAMVVLLLPVLAWGEPLPVKGGKRAGPLLCGFFSLYLLVFGGLLCLRRIAQRQIAALVPDDVNKVMDTLESAVVMDFFYDATYRMDYVTNAVALSNPFYEDSVQKYVKSLRADGTYYACSNLARSYYLPRGEFGELFACSREGIAQRASDVQVWDEQVEFYRNEVLYYAADHMEEYTEGVQALQSWLDEFNADRIGKITLSEENQAFLDLVSAGVEAGLSGGDLFQYLISGGGGAS